jgi:hypothetical protein
LPQESCVDAVTRVVGHIDTNLHYERVKWDDAKADAHRSGEVTVPDAPDLKVLTTGEGLNNNRVIYKYVDQNGCEVFDGCVGGSGWRRLLVFDSHDQNVGGKALFIGPIDYDNDGSIASQLIDEHVYEFSTCHGHYHFQYYGDFHYGDVDNAKNGFCLETTDRLSNNETSPLHTDFNCHNQGVQPGWGDLYNSSLVCNWVDVTDVDTSAGPVTQDLEFHSNPSGFLCEGDLVTGADGKLVFDATDLTDKAGDPVGRPECNSRAGVEDNDIGTVPVTLPVRGGFMSAACTTDQDVGPLRNCGFTLDPTFIDCTAGAPVTLTCTGGDAAKPQVVRVCETSRALGDAVDCELDDSLANVVVDAASVDVDVTCPAGRDTIETGGQVSIYTAPVLDSDGPVTITCTAP